MSPRLQLVERMTEAGLDAAHQAALLGVQEKTIHEYQYRVRHEHGERLRAPKGAAHQISELSAERDRMNRVLSDFEAGRIQADELPTDAHKYYGRIRQADEAIERLQGREKEGRMPAVEQELLREVLAERAAEIAAEWRAVEVRSAVEVGAATNYWRGRAEEFNATREAIVRQHPELARDLPAALEVDEIRVRQVVVEQEREQEKGLAVAR